MNIYTFSKEAIKKLAIKQTLSIYPILISALIAVYFIITHLEGDSPELVVIMIGIGVFMLIGGFFSSTKAISKVLTETIFLLDENSITKQIPNGQDTEIFFRDIKNQQHSKKGIILKAQKKQLLIPVNLTDFKELEKVIKNKTYTGIQNFDTKFKMNEVVLKNLVAIAVLLLLVSSIISEDKIVKIIAGVPLVLVLMYGIFHELLYVRKSSLSSEMLARAAILTLSLIAYLIYIAVYT